MTGSDDASAMPPLDPIEALYACGVTDGLVFSPEHARTIARGRVVEGRGANLLVECGSGKPVKDLVPRRDYGGRF